MRAMCASESVCLCGMCLCVCVVWTCSFVSVPFFCGDREPAGEEMATNPTGEEVRNRNSETAKQSRARTRTRKVAEQTHHYH